MGNWNYCNFYFDQNWTPHLKDRDILIYESDGGAERSIGIGVEVEFKIDVLGIEAGLNFPLSAEWSWKMDDEIVHKVRWNRNYFIQKMLNGDESEGKHEDRNILRMNSALCTFSVETYENPDPHEL